MTAGSATTTYCYDHADRLVSSSDPTVGTITYDTRGNTTQIFGETRSYDAADRHLTTTKGADTVTYVRDATDRIVERRVNGTVVARYSHTGGGDTPATTLNASNAVIEQTLTLPGGVLLTVRSTGNVWSYPDLGGSHVATANQAGTKQGGTVAYDPFGNLLAGAVPDNSAGNLDYGWLGQHQRPVDTQAGFEPTVQMGARQYSARLGRFLEVDPIEAGSANDYDYTNADPINNTDLDGLCSRLRRFDAGRLVMLLIGAIQVPCGFEYYYGPTQRVRINGIWYTGMRNGSCSTPGADVNAWNPFFDFHNACRVHDYAYDLLRWFGQAGFTLRVTADFFFGHLMNQSCIGRFFRSVCDGFAGSYFLAVLWWSEKQRWRVP